MAEVRETQLPGVGVRHEFTSDSGQQLGVISHRGGRKEVLIYDKDDPDACSTVVHLTEGDTRTLSELLGASQVAHSLAAVEQQIEGLAIDWVPIEHGSGFDGKSIADGMFRTRTGVSIVAVVRGATTVPAPRPDFEFRAGDTAVCVGTNEGLTEVRSLLRD
ncbi:cation:proton antiporter regulatory subunit [Ilumatobacteraceae bacterium]|jgi:TrkA domain protein|nr:cation:proton antiporter regulatory subunit [Ilumatobacteraceae bacterium]